MSALDPEVVSGDAAQRLGPLTSDHDSRLGDHEPRTHDSRLGDHDSRDSGENPHPTDPTQPAPPGPPFSLNAAFGAPPVRPDLIRDTERFAKPPSGGRLVTRDELLSRGPAAIGREPRLYDVPPAREPVKPTGSIGGRVKEPARPNGGRVTGEADLAVGEPVRGVSPGPASAPIPPPAIDPVPSAGDTGTPREETSGSVEETGSSAAKLAGSGAEPVVSALLPFVKKPNVNRVRKFAEWITGQGWTLASMPADAAEQYMAATSRDVLTTNALRSTLAAALAAGVPVTPQEIGPTDYSHLKGKKAKMSTISDSTPESGGQVKGEDFFPPPSAGPVATPTVASPEAPAPQVVRVEVASPEKPKRAAPGAATGPSHHAAPKQYLIELLNDGAIVPGLGPGRPVEIDTYPEAAVGGPEGLAAFLRDSVLPHINGVRPGVVVKFHVVELNDKRVRTGREWELPIFARAGGGAAPFVPPVAMVGGAPTYATPFAMPPVAPPPVAPPLNPIEQAAGTTYVEMLRKQLMDSYETQRKAIHEQSKGNPMELYQLQRDLDRRHDELLRKLEVLAEREAEKARAAAIPPPIVVPPPPPPEPSPEARMREAMIDKLLDKMLNAPAQAPVNPMGQMTEMMTLFKTFKELAAPPMPASPAENAVVSELRAELAAMKAKSEADKRESAMQAMVGELKAEIAALKVNRSSIDEMVQTVGKVHEAAQHLGIAKDQDGDDDDGGLLELALKNPQGTAQLIAQFGSLINRQQQQQQQNPLAGLPPEIQAEFIAFMRSKQNPQPGALPPGSQPPPPGAQPGAPVGGPTPPPQPPPTATEAIKRIDQLAFEPNDGDEFTEERASEIAQMLLGVITAWQGGDAVQQAQAQVFLAALHECKVFPDIYHVVKRVATLSGATLRHASIENVAGLLHDAWGELTTFPFGAPQTLEDTDDDEDEDEGKAGTEEKATATAPPPGAQPATVPAPKPKSKVSKTR